MGEQISIQLKWRNPAIHQIGCGLIWNILDNSWGLPSTFWVNGPQICPSILAQSRPQTQSLCWIWRWQWWWWWWQYVGERDQNFVTPSDNPTIVHPTIRKSNIRQSDIRQSENLLSVDITALGVRMVPLFQNKMGMLIASIFKLFKILKIMVIMMVQSTMIMMIMIVLFQDILDGFKIGASGQSCSHLRKSCRQPKIFLDQWSKVFSIQWSKYLCFQWWKYFCRKLMQYLSSSCFCGVPDTVYLIQLCVNISTLE